jgi:hypothetical protein
MQQSRELITEIEAAIEAESPWVLCQALGKVPTDHAQGHLMEAALAGATALVNWDACALDIIPHPGLQPTPDGRNLGKWLGDYLSLRLSVSDEAIVGYADGDCNALMLRSRISDLVRNIFFEFPLESESA